MTKMLTAYGSVDPGASGSICIYIPETKKIHFMSTAAKPKDIAQFFNQAQSELNLVITVIEDVHAIFGVSAKSNFNFGYNTGLITGIIQGTGAGIDRVTPKIWQKHVGVKAKGKEIKKDVAGICERMFPDADIYGPRGGLLDGRSDALMIAVYAAYKYRI